MRVLGLDVSGPGGGAALVGPSLELVATVPPDVRRGRDLVPRIRGLLEEGGLRPGELDGIACGVGPGSFTGIRIGCATAATLAYAAGLPVVAVGSLDGIAANAPADAPEVLVVLDARRGNVFAGRFAGGRPTASYALVPPERAVEGLRPDAHVLGDARARYPDVFGRFAGRADAPVRPDAIARLGAERLARGETVAPDALRPLYLRKSDPEIRAGS